MYKRFIAGKMIQKNSHIALGLIFFLTCSGYFSTGCRTAPDSVRNSNQTTVAEGSAPGENANSVNVKLESNKNTGEINPPKSVDKTQAEEVIDRYIKGVAKVSGASEYEDARKIVYGDVDGDGDEDAVAQFTIEGMGGGNNYGFWLAIFKNENGKFSGITDEAVGGKLNRNIDLKKIEDGKIYLDTTSYDGDDGACCPSIPGKTSYILQGNKLVEKKIK